MQGIAVSTFVLLAASALPAVSYYYVFQHDGTVLGPFAWTHWAIVGATCALAILAHALGSTGKSRRGGGWCESWPWGAAMSSCKRACMPALVKLPTPHAQSACAHPMANRSPPNGKPLPCPPPCLTVLLAAHVALGGMLGAGLGAFDTSFWLNLSTRWVPTNDAAWMALPHLTSCRTVMHLGPIRTGAVLLASVTASTQPPALPLLTPLPHAAVPPHRWPLRAA